jgi:hypothetical protein
MKTVKVILCSCGEDIFEDDFSRKVDGIEYLGCINCGKEYPKSALKEEEVVDITKESV